MQSVLGRVGEICSESGITKRAMARKIGVSPTAFRRKCDGRNPWKLDEAAKMAKMLGISLADFYELSSRREVA